MSENKNSPEKGEQILLVSQLCTMKMYFVRARVFNWLRVLTSLHAFLFFAFAFALNPWTAAVSIMTSVLQMERKCYAFISCIVLLFYLE